MYIVYINKNDAFVLFNVNINCHYIYACTYKIGTYAYQIKGRESVSELDYS